MSWYGTHPKYSKGEVAALLTPAACKNCIYWFRCAIGTPPRSWEQESATCPRCGIAIWRLLAALNQQLLGMSPPDPLVPDNSCNSGATPCKLTAPIAPTGNRTLDKWLALYASRNAEVRFRAARTLIRRADAPVPVLVEILDHLSHDGLGTAVEKALLTRSGPELTRAMIGRLLSQDPFIRQVACSALGRSGDFAATRRLLRMLDDPHMMVRRAAGFALASLKDPAAIPELTRQLTARRNDDCNVVCAIETALRELGVKIGRTA